ncbi:MAG TPA: sugar phosphate isomerase/epimerase [Candidatus Limnocylindrales bacterium]|nr:sugar phosphate isomerase/epimerase [Candidatus Limnocylindrales bacterium]
MKKPWANITRRDFFCRATLMGASSLAAAGLPVTAKAVLTKPDTDPCHGLKLGLTSYTLRKFSLEEAIAMTLDARVGYISLKDVHLPLKSTAEHRNLVRAKIEAAGLKLMGGGVIYLKNDEAEIRAAFQYAKDAGMPTLICSPDPAALDMVERLAREFQIRVAIHNHGATDKKYPSPLDVFHLIERRNPLMGICMDLGHTVIIGQDPIPIIKKCAGRLYDFHIKDITEPSAKGTTVEVGRGIIDIVGVLKTLVKIRYGYHLALEYEAKADAPVAAMRESFGYIRGVLAAI